MSGGVSAATIFSALGAAATVYSATQSGKGNRSAYMPQAAPVAAAPTVMPTPDDDAMKAAQRKQAMANQARRGRESTILSDPMSSDLLGG